MKDTHDDGPWTEMDIEDLTAALEHGSTIEDAAKHLCRCQYLRENSPIPLGTVRAPDEETARQQAIEFYSIPESQQFRVVATKVTEAKKPAKAKVKLT